MKGSDVFEERFYKINSLIKEREWEQASFLLKKTESLIKKSENEEIKGKFFRKNAVCNFEMAKKEKGLLSLRNYRLNR